MCWIYVPNFNMLLNFLKCNYFHKKNFFSHPTSLNLFSIYSSSYISTLYFHLKMYLLFIAIFFFFDKHYLLLIGPTTTRVCRGG